MKKHILTLTAAILLASCGGATSSSSSQAPSGSSSPEATSSKSEESSSKAESSSEESSSKAESTTEESSGTPDYFINEPTEIQFMSNSSYTDVIESYAEAFMKIEPNVTVTVSKETGSYQDIIDKTIQGIPANNYADLVVAYPDAVEQIMEVGKVVKLDPYIENEAYGWTEDDLSDIIESYMDEGRNYPRSGTFSLPFAKSTEAMFYNKDVVIGLDLSAQDPTINNGNALDENYVNNLTWDELFDKLVPAIVAYNNNLDEDAKILKTTGDYVDAVVGYYSADNMFITMAEQYGYGYTSIDDYGEAHLDFVNPEMKALMKKLNTYEDKGWLTTNSVAGNNYPNFCYTEKSALFSISSTGGLKYNVNSQFETGIAAIPQVSLDDRKVINQGPSLCILNHSNDNRALASWLFAKFMTNEENALDWAVNTGYLPIRYSVSESSEYQAEIARGMKADVTDLDHLKAVATQYAGNSLYVGDALFASPVFKGSSTARTQASNIVTSILTLTEAEATDAKIDEIFQTAYDNTLKAM